MCRGQEKFTIGNWEANLVLPNRSSIDLFVLFSKELVNVFNFHKYDHLAKSEEKLDPRKRTGDKNAGDVVNLMFGAATGDVTALRRWVGQLNMYLLFGATEKPMRSVQLRSVKQLS